jgi:hypothetical protein
VEKNQEDDARKWKHMKAAFALLEFSIVIKKANRKTEAEKQKQKSRNLETKRDRSPLGGLGRNCHSSVPSLSLLT